MADVFSTVTGILSAATTALTGRQDTLILPVPTTVSDTASRDRIVALHAAAIRRDASAVSALSDLATRGTGYERTAAEIALSDLAARRVISGAGGAGIVLSARVDPAGSVRSVATFGVLVLVLGGLMLFHTRR